MKFDFRTYLLAAAAAAALPSCSSDQSADTADAQGEVGGTPSDLVPEPIQAPSPIELEEAEDSDALADAPAAADSIIDDTEFERENPAQQPNAPTTNRSSIGPSYSCDGQLTNIERMVCEDSDLAQLEREMVARYNARRDASAASERQRYLSDQRRFLRQLRSCQTRSCIASAYRQRIGELGQ